MRRQHLTQSNNNPENGLLPGRKSNPIVRDSDQSVSSNDRNDSNNQSYPNGIDYALSGISSNDSDPVVACLNPTIYQQPSKAQDNQKYPYTAISLSPCRRYAVTACKDRIQIVSVSALGLRLIKTILVGQYLQVPTTNSSTPTTPTTVSSSRIGTIMDSSLFTRVDTNPSQPSSTTMINVAVNDVAWSDVPYPTNSNISSNEQSRKDDSSWTDIAKDLEDDNDDDLQQQQQNDFEANHHTTPHGEVAIATSGSSSHESTKGRKRNSSRRKNSFNRKPSEHSRGSLIAAAGSNGVILVWNAETLLDLFTQTPSDSVAFESQQQPQQNQPLAPDAVLSQYGRDINRLAWHPTKHGLLLSASQDGTVRLWERRKLLPSENENGLNDPNEIPSHDGASFNKITPRVGGGMFSSLFGNIMIPKQIPVGPIPKKTSYQWHIRTNFEPKSEAVRDIKWSPHYEDVFALVTSSGALIAYSQYVSARALVKMNAHSGDATSLDWHPTKRNIIATGGARDRCVKIWNLEHFLSVLCNSKEESNIYANANTLSSRGDSVVSDSSGNDSHSQAFSVGTPPTMRTISSVSTFLNTSRHKGGPKVELHQLSISAAVSRLRWRPPSNDFHSKFGEGNESEDRHESMIVVATAPVQGTIAGGAGMLSLWSYNRPFMPLSIVEGHSEGAVSDFCWLDTPKSEKMILAANEQSIEKNLRSEARRRAVSRQISSDLASEKRLSRTVSKQQGSSVARESEHMFRDNNDVVDEETSLGLWQHVLSVGRDGRCMVQSLVRGYRPISRVPPSCFTMGNLSPFQKGYGSLQVLSVCQKVPSSSSSDFYLTGLRRDAITADAPGIFREEPAATSFRKKEPSGDLMAGTRIPESDLRIVFSVVDQGDLDDELMPIEDEQKAIIIGPEVVHLSRFAERYRLYRDDRLVTRVDLCLHNCEVAESLRFHSLAYMWRMVASMLDYAKTDGLPDPKFTPQNPMQYAVVPTIHSLLVERAEAGDVQTCVALCEVLEVLMEDETVRIPDLEIELVREWYLSYIDLLRDMCLFSHATYLIRSCKDPFVNSLNQKSTTFHEACPQCGKALDAANRDQDSSVRRLCKNCRRRVGMCFLCHQPVKGLYVWCPGCGTFCCSDGHGGHLDCALQWFGGLNAKSFRECCPTGCGHRCNMFQKTEGIPKDYIVDTKVDLTTDWLT